MIEVKRCINCSVIDDPANHAITFRAFTIKIDEGSYDIMRGIMDEVKLDAAEALRFVIYEGLNELLGAFDFQGVIFS